ncbi:MAG: alpha/beta hydrolase [Crocinitomicaceae bacterium]|nr:alpha/beta hydrolase-fold protein [Flavobacteriales bacterium]NQZ35944.1 alpha/beta hydrolase [Crocinitomicaceae bacterium]
MKKNLFTLIILIITANCYAQDGSGTVDRQDNAISIGHIDTIYSEILHEHRGLWIHLPRGAKNPIYNNTYPVLYLLDGDAHFHSVTGLITQLSDNGNTKLPEMIVVGIPNTDRMRDMTPTNVDSNPTSGGASNFLDFMEKELMPYIEKNYPAANNKTFIGHSLGGLAVLNAFLHRPQMFNNYVAIDPSLRWDNQYLLKRTDSILSRVKFENKSLYVGVANTLVGDLMYSTIMTDTTKESIQIRSVLEFTNKVDELKVNSLNFKWKYYGDDTHNSVPLITEYDALRFMYSWFECDWYNDVFNGGTGSTGKELADLINEHYLKVSTKMGCPVYPGEGLINSIAYWFSRSNQAEKGYAFFNLNIQNYPKSYNAYDSMGDYYVMQEDWENAITFFTKSMELGAGEITKDKLENLKNIK